MPSKAEPLSDAELEACEANRDLAAELLQSVREMKTGKTEIVLSLVVEARQRTGLSQSQFADLLGVSVRTLQGWEQGRKQPSGAHASHDRAHKPEGAPGGRRQVVHGLRCRVLSSVRHELRRILTIDQDGTFMRFSRHLIS